MVIRGEMDDENQVTILLESRLVAKGGFRNTRKLQTLSVLPDGIADDYVVRRDWASRSTNRTTASV